MTLRALSSVYWQFYVAAIILSFANLAMPFSQAVGLTAKVLPFWSLALLLIWCGGGRMEAGPAALASYVIAVLLQTFLVAETLPEKAVVAAVSAVFFAIFFWGFRPKRIS